MDIFVYEHFTLDILISNRVMRHFYLIMNKFLSLFFTKFWIVNTLTFFTTLWIVESQMIVERQDISVEIQHDKFMYDFFVIGIGIINEDSLFYSVLHCHEIH